MGFNSCSKKDINSTSGPILGKEVQDRAFFRYTNGELAKEDFLDKTIMRFKFLDEQRHFANGLKAKYGNPKWDLTLVIRNKDSLFTLVTPFINENDSVTAIMFAYHPNTGKTVYRIYNKNNYKQFFSNKGNDRATTINRSSVEGLFNTFEKNNKAAQVRAQGTAPRTVITYTCWRYTWSGVDANGDPVVGASMWQCTYDIYNDPSSGGGTGGDPNCGCGGGSGSGGDGPKDTNDKDDGTQEVYVYEEKISPNQQIIDSLQKFPCAQRLLAELPDMKNTVSDMIKKVFADSTLKNELIFMPKVDLHDARGNKAAGLFYGGANLVNKITGEYQVTGTIYLDDNLLKYGTKEAILAVMLHETLHAYLALEKKRLTPTQFGDKYSSLSFYIADDPNSDLDKFYQFIMTEDHGQMATNYRNALQDALKTYNPVLPTNVAEVLSLGGFFSSTSFPNDVILTINYEQDTRKINTMTNQPGFRGSKCETN